MDWHRARKLEMISKIMKAGDSTVVEIPGEILHELRLGEGAEVNIELDATQSYIVISPAGVALPGIDEQFAKQVSEFIDQYRPALEALAR
jgi:antitoxin component of MazEF toxin-antitoxin module